MPNSIKSKLKSIFDGMRKLFPVTKTIAFRLVPTKQTEENLKRDGIVKTGFDQLEEYQLVKKAADRIHQGFIESVLVNFRLKFHSEGNIDSIEEYAEVYRDKKLEKKVRETKLAEIAQNIKAQIGKAFKSYMYDNKKSMLDVLAGQELVKDILPKIELSKEEKTAVKGMSQYTSRMRPYFKLRDMLYDNKAKGNTVPNRIVDDNLPIHLNNATASHNIPDEIFDKFNEDEYMRNYVHYNTHAEDVREVFMDSYFSLLCSQSAIDVYNTIIGGVTEKDEIHHKGLNELINLQNMELKDKRAKYPMFNKLKKQILTERSKVSFIPKSFETDEEIVNVVKSLYEELRSFSGNIPAVISPDRNTTYINAKSFSYFSRDAYGKSRAVEYGMKELLRNLNPRGARKSEKAYEEMIEKMYKNLDYASLADIETGLEMNGMTEHKSVKEFLGKAIYENLKDAFRIYGKLDKKIGITEKRPLTEKLGQDDVNGKQGAGSIVKEFMDCVNDIVRTVRLFYNESEDLTYDEKFYNEVIAPLSDFGYTFTKAYNSVRNYLTKKPYKTDKVRLYFGTPDFLSGWDVGQMGNKRGVFFRKDGKILLGIIASSNKKLFDGQAYFDPSSPLEMLRVDILTAASKAIPKVLKAKANGGKPRSVFDMSPEIAELVLSKKVGEMKGDEVTKYIDISKAAIAGDPKWKAFGFTFKDSKEYEKVNDFYMDMDDQAYVAKYAGVSEAYVDKAVEKGDLYLFEITCQDMLEKHYGKDGIYKVLIQEALRDMNGVTVKLQGNAQIYYRKPSLDRKVTHPAGIAIPNKNPDSVRKEAVYNYDIIKDRRYTEDRYMIHLPVTIYPRANKFNANRINGMVQDIIKENPGMYVLGINRGERNLISIAITAPDGTIVEQRSLNVFDNFDYRKKLNEREKERKEDRKNWNAVSDIKNIKAGYLSRVVGEVTKLVRKYDCIIAIEHLDADFKESRAGIEMNIYNQFERDLIKKLALVTDKDDPDRLQTALQLANPGDNEADRNKYSQNGIVFFMRPNWVTKTDPLTGFVNMIDLYIRNINDAELLMSSMDGFRYNLITDRFELKFRYGMVEPGKITGDPDKVWTVETFGERVDDGKVVVPTLMMKELFDKEGIRYKDGKDIIAQMKGRSRAFWDEFLNILGLTLQLVNWYPNTKEQRIIGCTADKDGNFYDSRKAPESMPKDGDINAAWNLARKAHMVMNNIRNYKPGETLDYFGHKAKSPVLTVFDEEWLDKVAE